MPLSELSVKWAIGQPDHVYTDNCAVFLINGTLKGVQCDDAFQYICYKKYEPLKINKCNTVDNGEGYSVSFSVLQVLRPYTLPTEKTSLN